MILEVIKMKKKFQYFVLILVLFNSFMINVLATEPVEATEASCNTLLGTTIISYLKTGFTIIQIVGVLLAIILGMTDFMGAILAGDADSNKKAVKKLIVRVAMAAVLLIVPAILKFILTTFGVSDGEICIL